VLGRSYLSHQIATLLKLVQATRDPQVAAGLLDKAATLREQLDRQSDNNTPRPPDVIVPH